MKRERQEKSRVPIEIELMRSVFLLLFTGVIIYLGGYALWLPLLGQPWQGPGRAQDAMIAGVLLILFIAFGAAGLYSARGLLLEKGSAWTMSVDLSVAKIISQFVFQLERQVTEPYLGPIGASWYALYITDIVMLVYLTRPRIRAVYRRD